MAKTELIFNLLFMSFCLITATRMLSDRISERGYTHPIFKTVVAILLSLCSSLGLAILVGNFLSFTKLWQILALALVIISIHFGMSVSIGMYKREKDKKRH